MREGRTIAQRWRQHGSSFLEDIMDFLKNTLILFQGNLVQICVFIPFCCVFSLASTSLLKLVSTDLVMYLSGTTYISPENLLQVMFNPPCILVLVIEQVLATLIALFQIAGLLHAFSMAQIGLTTNLVSMFGAGLRTCRKAIHPKNWLIVVFMLVLLPLTKVMSLSGTTYKLVIPGFINQTIEYTASLRAINAAVYAVLLSCVLIFIFSINFFVLRDDDFVQSCAESRALGKGRYLNTVVSLGILTLLVNAAINTVASALTVNVSEFIAFLNDGTGIVTRSARLGTYTYALRTVLQSLLLPAINNAGLTVLFYRYIDEQELVSTLSRNTFKMHRIRAVTGKRLAIGASLALAVLVGLLTPRYAFLAEPVDRPLVCAHRGDNVNAPENTMPAFKLAFSENLSWIELDCHQTSDGVIVVSHDDNIKRVTGHNLKISDHTFAELECYEMGDWMPGVYEHVHVPTLEQVLLSAREHGVNVQVELKGSSGDVDFEEHVLGVIDSCGMHDHVMVICQDAKRMMRVAELDPTITKGYCMFVALGQVEDIPYTDNVTIEETNVTPELVHRLHEKGILVFCWTVDLEDTVQYLVSCDVDVIGTDNPLLVSAALDHADYSGGFPRALNVFLHTIASMAR